MKSAEFNAAVDVMMAVVESVREAGPAGIGAGVLFATLQTQGCSLKVYQQIEAFLIASDVLKKQNDVLVWVG